MVNILVSIFFRLFKVKNQRTKVVVVSLEMRDKQQL